MFEFRSRLLIHNFPRLSISLEPMLTLTATLPKFKKETCQKPEDTTECARVALIPSPRRH
jgi:hypothetical protein